MIKNKTKRALVLAGGGAKGAYAFGCMKAFEKKGIELMYFVIGAIITFIIGCICSFS